MKLKLGDILIAKTSFQNTYTTNSFFVKNKKYSIRLLHVDNYRKGDDRKDSWRSRDYIVVNNLPGYTFYIEEMYKDEKDYIWNCFYTPLEIRKMKLQKINQNV